MNSPSQGGIEPVVKRFIDVLVSVVVLVVLSPILLGCALAVMLTSPGGALFKQQRIGRHCQPFTIYKFRSMVANAPEVGSFRTSAGDPRITKVGKFLRKTSLDEFPQFLNVIKGDMSLVGPRPDTPAQESDYSPEDWMERHLIRPGITGLAQAKSRQIATPEERLAMDLAYVRTNSLALDFHICWLTVLQLVKRGSY